MLSQKFTSLDEFYYKTTNQKLLLNNIGVEDTISPEETKSLLFNVFDSTTISVIPSCPCGSTVGMINVDKVCSHCGKVVTSKIEPSEPHIWAYKIHDKLPFLNPYFYLVFNSLVSTNKVDIGAWLMGLHNDHTNVPYFIDEMVDIIIEKKVNTKIDPLIAELNSIQLSPEVRDKLISKIKTYTVKLRNFYKSISRTYRFFIMHLGNYLEYLARSRATTYTKVKREQIEILFNIYKSTQLLNNYLPLPPKNLSIIDITPKGSYLKGILSESIEVFNTLVHAIDNQKHNPVNNEFDKGLNKVMGNVISRLAYTYKWYINKYLSRKQGLFRQAMYSQKINLFYGVISLIQGEHRYNETRFPWVALCTHMRPYVVNKLVKQGYTYIEASKIIIYGVNNYHPLLADIGKEIIKESYAYKEHKGLPLIDTRSPTLKQHSTIKTYLTKFKDDPKDLTISIPIISSMLQNSDIDGDSKAFLAIPDKRMHELSETYSPEYGIPDLDYPYQITGLTGLPKTIIQTMLCTTANVKVKDNIDYLLKIGATT